MQRGFASRCLALLGLIGIRLCSGGYIPPTKYLIMSNAANGTIGYVQLSRTGNISAVRTLIDRDLKHPQGIAIDQKRQLLLVADSDLRKVVSYGLTVHEDGSLGVDDQSPVAEDLETRWVAVDGLGNVFMTDEQGGRILKISARQVLDGDTAARSVFADDGTLGGAIASPGGVVTDNFHVYWTNKRDGQATGTVVRSLVPATNMTDVAPQPVALSKNVPKAYGLCMAMDTIYYTDVDHNVYAVRASGGDVVQVSSQFANPRGCAWDGESTIYIADRSADGVFALDGPSLSLAEVSAKKAVDFQGAFGVAVFSSAHASCPSAFVIVSLMALVAATLAHAREH